MAKYVIVGRYSASFAEGMLHTPHDRLKIVVPIMKNMGAEVKEFLLLI